MNTLEAAKEEAKKIRDEIKDKERHLGRLEKTIELLSPEKPKPKTKADAPAASAPVSPGKTPDRIVAFIADNGRVSAETLSEVLAVPLGTIRSTCSRLKREGRLVGIDVGGKTLYGGPGGEPAEDAGSPFEAQ